MKAPFPLFDAISETDFLGWFWGFISLQNGSSTHVHTQVASVSVFWFLVCNNSWRDLDVTGLLPVPQIPQCSGRPFPWQASQVQGLLIFFLPKELLLGSYCAPVSLLDVLCVLSFIFTRTLWDTDDDDDDNDGDIPSLQIKKLSHGLCRAEIYFDSKAHIFFPFIFFLSLCFDIRCFL